MPTENAVFRKIKEMSARAVHPRPAVNIKDLANELSVTTERLMPWLRQLKQMRLLNFGDKECSVIKLTMLGCVSM